MDTIFHLLIPIAILFLLKFDKKWALYMSPLAILPDFDHVIPIVPRGLFHNLLFAITIFVISFVIFKKDKKKIFVACFFIASHLLLDFNGIALFYPFSSTYYGIEATIGLNKKTLQITPSIKFIVSESYAGIGGDYSEGYIATKQASLVVFLVVFSIFLFKAGKFIAKKIK